MIVNAGNEADIRHEAQKRQARARLDAIDNMRAAKQAENLGKTQREIAELIYTNQTKVARMLKAVALHGGTVPVDPEEMILRAFAYDSPRATLMAELKAFPYSDGEAAPYPHDGYVRGTWDQVEDALVSGYITEDEFEEVRRSVGR